MKKNLLALFAVVLAIAFSAFTTNSHPTSTKKTGAWYSYSGAFTANAEKTPGNYTLGQPSCTGSADLCGLFIDPAFDGDGSSLSQTDILDVINNGGVDVVSTPDGIVDTEVNGVSDMQN